MLSFRSYLGHGVLARRKVTKTFLKGQDVACHKLGFAKADTEVELEV